jgi:hypothetical protein
VNRRSTKSKKKAKDDNNVATYKKHFQSYKKERKTTNFEKMTNSNIENIESKKKIVTLVISIKLYYTNAI